MIAPAPRKPIPVTICAAIRVGSARTTLCPEARNAWKPYGEGIVKRADPSETRGGARTPAPGRGSPRRRPTAARGAAGGASRSRTSHQSSVGTLCTERALLGVADPRDAGLREVEHLVERGPRERRPLRRRLHLDEVTFAGDDDVHVHLGARVLGVVEVEERLALDDADRDRGHGGGKGAAQAEAVERPVRGDVRAGDRGAARAAVGLEDVAVDPERALAERLEIDHRPQRTADQPLDRARAPALLAARGLAFRAVTRRGRQERVLRGEPAAPLPVEPARDAVLNRRRAEHFRLALREEHRAVRLLEEVRPQVERPQLVGPPPVGAAHAAAARSSSRLTRSTSAIGSWRKRAPIARNATGSPVVRKRYVPSRDASFSIPFRASVSATSRAVSSALKTSVTPRPKTRWKIGRTIG